MEILELICPSNRASLYPEGPLLLATWVGVRIPSFGRVRKGKAAQLAASGGPVTSCVCLNAYGCSGKIIINQMPCGRVPTHRELGQSRRRVTARRAEQETLAWVRGVEAHEAKCIELVDCPVVDTGFARST